MMAISVMRSRATGSSDAYSGGCATALRLDMLSIAVLF